MFAGMWFYLVENNCNNLQLFLSDHELMFIREIYLIKQDKLSLVQYKIEKSELRRLFVFSSLSSQHLTGEDKSKQVCNRVNLR